MVKWKHKTNLSLSVSKNHKQRKKEPEDTTHMIQQEYPPPKVIKKRKKRSNLAVDQSKFKRRQLIHQITPEGSTCSLQNSHIQTEPSATKFMDTCQTISHEVANLENEFETCEISENPSTPTALTTQQLEETTLINQYHHFNTQAYFP